ncbi:MAG: hypothetical protein C4308_06810 [Chitinophagaceae bacterium]
MKINFLTLIFLFFLSCQKEVWQSGILSSEKTIISFKFLKSDNPVFSSDIEGIISGTNITLITAPGTDGSALKPAIVHTGKSITPSSEAPANFSIPVNYTVKAEDGSEKIYAATVAVQSVYIAGEEFNGTEFVAKYWKEGVATNLTDGT